MSEKADPKPRLIGLDCQLIMLIRRGYAILLMYLGGMVVMSSEMQYCWSIWSFIILVGSTGNDFEICILWHPVVINLIGGSYLRGLIIWWAREPYWKRIQDVMHLPFFYPLPRSLIMDAGLFATLFTSVPAMLPLENLCSLIR